MQPKTQDVLQYLLERSGELVTREELLRALWPGEAVHENNLTQHIFLLRQSLAQHAPGLNVVVTISGKGYRTAVPVEVRSPVTLLRSPAWRWYARGRLLSERLSRESLGEALQCFERALRLDASLADAHAGVAEVRVALATCHGLSPAVEFPLAESAARNALGLVPEHAEAHSLLGDAAFLYRYDFERALEHYGRSLRYAPQRPRALAGKAFVYCALAKHAVARQEIEGAVALCPVSLDVLTMYGATGFYAGSVSEAAERFNDVLQIDERFERAAYYLAMCRALEGKRSEVRALRERFGSGVLVEPFAAAEGFACAMSGDFAAARLALAHVRSPVLRAQIHAGAGNGEEAMRELSVALARRDPLFVYAGVHPFFTALRGRRDFQALVEGLMNGRCRLNDDDSLLLAGRGP